MKVWVMLGFCLVFPFLVLFVNPSTIRPGDYNFLKGINVELNQLPNFTGKSSPTSLEEESEDEEDPLNNSHFKINKFQRGFTQKLDHFNSTDTRYWTQRYLVNKGKYENGRAVYLLLGGTDAIQPCDCKTGLWNYFAQESNALLIHLEHRFYGKSYATRDYSTENLVYLSTEQALADIAYFIDEMTNHNPNDISIPLEAKWIAMGSAYGGMLAALFKMKFPHKLRGAIAENAPLMPVLNIQGYYSALEDQCAIDLISDTLLEAFIELKDTFNICVKGDRSCIQKQFNELRNKFNFCLGDLATNYDIEKDKAFLYWSLATTIDLALRYGNENNLKIRTNVINILLNKDETPNALDRLGLAVKEMLNSHDIECLLIDYSTLVEMYQNTSLLAELKLNYILYEGFGNRQYAYQRCAEWGHFETADKDTGIFAKLIPLNFYQNLCTDIFGSMFNSRFLNRAITRTLMFYGGQEIKVRDVLFIVSKDDYWHNLGYLGYLDRKPRKKHTDDDNFTFVLKDQREHNAFIDMIDDWTFMLKKLKYWSEFRAIEDTAHSEDKFYSAQEPDYNVHDL